MKKIKAFVSLTRLFSLVAVILLVPGIVKAATLTVTSSADTGAGTLRNAITAAVANDTIDFNLGSDQVITLASQLPTINKNLTIQNTSGFNVTVSGNFTSRVFQITAGTVTLKDINITGGRTTTAATNGAGILVQNAGTVLNLTNTSFFSNVTAGGANGGALQNEGATVNILNSTFSGNAAAGSGGAINNSSGTVNISFTTIIGNISNVDTASAANGGGVFNESGATLRIKNSILANNNALVSSGPECASGTPNAITSLGGNIIFNPAGCGNLTIPGGAKPDITFVSPVVGALQDNGGATLTQALLTGSPAIDTADCVVPGGQSAFFTCPSTDQIGTSRPQGGGLDRGSFEFRLGGAASQADLQVDNRVDNSTPTVGNSINYTVSVLNKGPNSAQNLRMTALLDPGLTVNSVTPSGIGGSFSCSTSNSIVICTGGTLGVNVGSLTPPYTAQYVINATVNAGGPISVHASIIDLTNQDPDPTNNNDTAEINSAGAAGPSADLSITKTVDKPLSSIGDTVVYTMAVKNSGPSNATGVSVRDFISGPFSLVSNTASGGCSTLSSSNGLELLCNVGTINNGATTTFTITGTVDQAGQVDNIATVYAGTNASDPNLENNVAVASTVVQAAASTQIDLGIVKFVDEPMSTVGDTVTFTLGYINNNLTGDAQNVVIRDFISGPFGYVSDDFGPANTSACTATAIGSGTELICPVGLVSANSAYTFHHVTGTVGPQSFNVGQVDNIATIYDPADPSIPYAGSEDPNPSNNSAVASTIVQAPEASEADLSVTKTVDKPQSQAGDTVTFTVVVHNDGPDNAFGVKVRDFISGPFTYTTDTAPGLGGCSPTAATNGTELICNIGEVDAASDVTFTVVGTVGPGGGQVDNTATVYDTTILAADFFIRATFDPNVLNNIAVASTVVTVPICGDGIQEGIEQCDDGANNGTLGDPCDGTCHLLPVCGDGIQEGVEQCDDGNTVGGDGCSSSCRLECVDLSITKTVDQAQALTGSTVHYTLTIKNNEPVSGRSASNVVVTDQHSGPLSNYQNLTTTLGSCDPAANPIHCTLGAMAPQEVATIEYDADIGLGQIDNIASVSDTDNPVGPVPAMVDPNPTNNSAVASVIGFNPSAPNVDLSVLKSVNVGQAVVGTTDAVTFTITVNNPDPVKAPTVHLTDSFGMAAGAFTMTGSPNFTTGGGTCSGSLPTLTCDIDTWSTGQAVITITGTLNSFGQIDNHVSVADTTGNSQDPNFTNNSSTASVIGISSGAPNVDLSVLKSVNVGQAVVGTTDAVTFTITVSNPDTATAPTVHLTDNFGMAAGAFTMTGSPSFTTGGGTCSGSLPTLTCDIDTWSTGQAVITITGTINSLGQIDDHVSVADTTGGSQDPNLTNNSSTASVIGVNASAQVVDLSVLKSVNVGQAVVGTTDAVTFTVTVSNPDPSDAPTVHVTDSFGMAPGAFTMTGSPSFTTGGGTCSGSLPTLTCDIDTWATGQAVFTITGTINSLGQIDNHVSVADTTGATQDNNLTNNNSTASVIGVSAGAPAVDLSVSKSVNVGQAITGVTDAVTFTVTVTNPDTTNAPTVHVTDSFGMAPGAFTMTGSPIFTTGGGTCSGSLPTLTCDIDTWSTDQAVFTITGTINSLGQIDNHVSVADTTGGTQDPNLTNNNSTASVIGISPAAPSVDLSVLKSVNVGQAIIGVTDAVTFTITVNNPDTTNVPTVHLTDTFGMAPAAFTMTGSPSFTTGGGSCSGSLPSLTCDIDTWSTGQAVITITGTINSVGQIDNHASVADTSGGSQDPNPTNNGSTASVIGINPATPTTDLSLTKTVDLAHANINDTVTFTVSVTNNDSTNTADGVRITDISVGPMQVQTMAFTSGTGVCTPSLALPASAQPFLSFVCVPTNGKIGPGATVDLTMTAKITGEGQIDNTASADVTITRDPDQSNNTAVASVNGTSSADLKVTKTVLNGPTFNIGDTVNFEITIENQGPNDATNVTLTDMQLGGLTFDSPPAGCTASGNNMTCDVVPTLASGASVTLDYSSTASVDGLWSNIATVSSDVEDRIMSNNTTSANVSVGVSANTADLAVTKTADVTEVKEGGDIHYTVVVTNNGPNDAANVVLNDFIAGPFDSVSNIQITPAGTCSELNGLITCSVPNLPSALGFNTVTVTYTVTSSNPGSISNLAVVSGSVLDPIQDNNSEAYQVQVFDALADLSITKSVAPNPGVAGGAFTYNILVKNAGPDTAKNAIVVDQLSGKFTGVTATPSTGSCTTASEQADTTTLTCDLGDLASGAQATITIKVTGDSPASVLSNLAAVYSDTHDPLLGNNVATADTIQAGEGPIPTPSPTAGPTTILEGHGAFAKVGGCAMLEGANSSAPWAALMVLAVATAWVVAGRRRAR